MVVVFVALLVALSLMGVGVSYWSDTLTISGTVETGTWGIKIGNPFNCYTYPDHAKKTEISCSVDNDGPEVTLEVTVTKAHVAVDYYCDFHIENNGTTPVKIQSIDLSDLPVGVTGVEREITGEVAEGVLIDPGQAKDGTVHVYLTDGTSQKETFTFTVTFSAVLWNQ
ncbi:hypothetical protein ES703_14443 [subsurface metagenome]